MKMGSVDLIICQEGSKQIPYCQVGRDEQVSFDQPEEMIEQMSSEMILDQQVQLTKEEDLRDLLMIGGIGIFLPLSLEKAEVCIANVEIVEDQSVVTIRKEELEKTLEAA